MNENFDRSLIVNYWIEKAYRALDIAKYNFEKGFLDATLNRLYYSAFYILLAYLTLKGERFKKHSGVKSFFFRELIGKGLLDKDFGDFYKELYYLREKADYQPLAEFSKDKVQNYIPKTEKFLKAMEILIKKEMEKN